jgi:hypothetical protein
MKSRRLITNPVPDALDTSVGNFDVGPGGRMPGSGQKLTCSERQLLAQCGRSLEHLAWTKQNYIAISII